MKLFRSLLIGLLTLAASQASYATFTPITDVFSGTNSGSGTLSLGSQVLTSGSVTNSVGPGYTGILSLPAGVAYTLSMNLNASTDPGELQISGSGVAGLAGTFDATKTFTGDDLDPNTLYIFTLTDTASASLSALSSLNFDISQGGITLADTTSGTGLLGGSINLLNAFGTGQSASFEFLTPTNVSNAPIVLTFSGGTAAGLLGSSVTFSDASLAVASVPEPETNALLGAGALAAILRARSVTRKFRGIDD